MPHSGFNYNFERDKNEERGVVNECCTREVTSSLISPFGREEEVNILVMSSFVAYIIVLAINTDT